MPTATASLLIVDDDPALRACLSAILGSFGYGVRDAADGFSALAALRQEIPEIIVSDLNMPGMSGFEFLSVVRRRFPAIPVVAMSAVAAEGVPSGIAADAFYQKGSGPGSLLQIIGAMASPDRPPLLRHSRAPAPIWVERNAQQFSGAPFIMLTCPECLRIFPRVSLEVQSSANEARCIYCNGLFRYAVVQSSGRAPRKALRRTQTRSHIPPENACNPR
ncbi:MAG: response regulator [Acidobacteriaceae bacterium]|jgi:CheY-like chemotaxis protein